MDQNKIRLVLKLLTIVAKTGQWRNLFQLLYWVIMGKKTWDEAMDRATGVFYERQLAKATEDYKSAYPDDFKTTVNIDGYDKWVKRSLD